MTRFDLAASLSPSIRPSVFGTICHDSPNLSFSQPHASALGSVHYRKGLARKRNAGMFDGSFFVRLFILAVAKNMAYLCIVEY